MKEMIDMVYGNELRWFKGLSRHHQICVTYAIISVILVLTLWCDKLWLDGAMAVNLAIAMLKCKRVDGRGIKD